MYEFDSILWMLIFAITWIIYRDLLKMATNTGWFSGSSWSDDMDWEKDPISKTRHGCGGKWICPTNSLSSHHMPIPFYLISWNLFDIPLSLSPQPITNTPSDRRGAPCSAGSEWTRHAYYHHTTAIHRHTNILLAWTDRQIFYFDQSFIVCNYNAPTKQQHTQYYNSELVSSLSQS